MSEAVPANKAYAHRTLLTTLNARRIDRTIGIWQPSAGQEEGDQGCGGGQDERGPGPDRLREEVHEGLGNADAGTEGCIGEADRGRARTPS